MKIVYIAHPVSGDVKGNIWKILRLCNKYHTDEILPFAPYIVTLQYLDDNVEEERLKGIMANLTLFKSGVIDEVWVCGDTVSYGVKQEIELANQLGIPVIFKNENGTS